MQKFQLQELNIQNAPFYLFLRGAKIDDLTQSPNFEIMQPNVNRVQVSLVDLFYLCDNGEPVQ